MNATWPTAKAKVRHRPAMPLRVDRDGIERALDKAETNNGSLIFHGHVADAPCPCGRPPALMLEAASRRQTPVLDMAEALLCAGA